MFEPGSDGAAAVPMSAWSVHAATSPSRRSPSAAVGLSSGSPASAAVVPSVISAGGVLSAASDGAPNVNGGSGGAVDGVLSGGGPMASPPVGAASMPHAPNHSPAGLATDDEEPELDMFDIELQREFQSKVTPPAAFPAGVNAACVSPPTAGLGSAPFTTGNGRWSAQAGSTARGPHSSSPRSASAAVESSSKQFASLADMCQTSNFLERREDVQRLVHRLAMTIHNEMHVALDHGVLVTVTGHNNGAGSAVDGLSQRGTPVVSPPPPAPVALGSAARSFEHDVHLVNLVVSEVARRYANAAPSPSSPRAGLSALGAAPAAAPTASRDALSKNGRSHCARQAGALQSPTSAMRGQPLSQAHSHRGAAGAQTLHPTPQQPQVRRDYMSGRSTIDTEVNDSLGRIHASSVLPHHSHFQPNGASSVISPQPFHEPVQRPGNPYPGIHSHSRAPAVHPGVNLSDLPRVALLHTRDAPTARAGVGAGVAVSRAGMVSRVAASAAEHLTAWDTRSNHSTATTARSESGVQCPRAVKPEASSTHAKTSGPRNRTGKNIVPSDRSAFSECSGGETRSSFHSQMNSTFRHNHSSSTCRTADTSVSGAMPTVTITPSSFTAGAGGRGPVVGQGSAAMNVAGAKDELHAPS